MKKTLVIIIALVASTISFSQTVSADSAKFYINKEITVTGIVVDTYVGKGEKKVVLLNFGQPHPNETFTAVINQEDLASFKYDPAEFLKNKKVSIKGKVIVYKEKPEIIVTKADQITINK